MKTENKDFLPFAMPILGQEEIDEVVDTLKSGWITNGPKTKKFSEKIKAYLNCRNAIPVGSCTFGLHLSLRALGIKEGDEVITTPFTFLATVNSILYQRATPVFVDIMKENYNIDPNKIEEKITEKTKAIIPVHHSGNPCDMDKIMKIADENNLLVIEDAAHSIGAEYKGKKLGLIGNVGCYSFYPTKSMTTSEGGAVVTNDDSLAEKIELLSFNGADRNAWKRESSKGSWYYEILDLGYKYYMTDVQAAIGLHQLDKLDEFIRIREKCARLYNKLFSDVPEVSIPKVVDDCKPARHLYPIIIDTESLKIGRDEFMIKLKDMGVGSSVHFIPMHMQPYYKKRFGFNDNDYPNSKWVFERIISIPLHAKMNDEDVIDVVEKIKSIIESERI